MRPVPRRGVARLANARVAVWGRGAEGTAAVALARARGAEVTVVDDRVEGALADHAEASPPTVVLAPAVVADGDFDVVLHSPGVSRYRPELAAAAARGSWVTTMTALWFEDFGDETVVAITGSKGKTTTALLVAAALEASGRRVTVAGNMGRPLAELYAPDAPAVDAYVVEVSSYQAAELTVSPPVGVLTLLAPDHLQWHGSYERYVADKLNLFAHRPRMVVAVNATDPPSWAATGALAGRVGYGAACSPIGLAPSGEGDEGASGVVMVEGIAYGDVEILARTGLRLRGRHNLVNLCGALSAARAVTGVVPPVEALARVLATAAPLPSRLRTVAVTGGLEFVDDTLASNPAGTVAALETFAGRRICLVAGGADRGVPFEPLVAELVSLASSVSVVALGPAGARLVDELAAASRGTRAPRVVMAVTVREAVEQAASLVGKSGVVLFSPGAPTPSEEGTYVERSAAFAEAVHHFVAEVDTTAADAPCPP